MATTAEPQSGRGSVLSIGVSTTTLGVTTVAYTPIGQIQSVAFSGNTVSTADTSSFENDGYRTFIGIICDSGTTKISGTRDSSDAGQQLVTAAFGTFDVVPLRITLPLSSTQTTQGDVISWNCLIQSSDFEVSVEKVLNFEISTKNSGAISCVVGS